MDSTLTRRRRNEEKTCLEAFSRLDADDLLRETLRAYTHPLKPNRRDLSLLDYIEFLRDHAEHAGRLRAARLIRRHAAVREHRDREARRQPKPV